MSKTADHINPIALYNEVMNSCDRAFSEIAKDSKEITEALGSNTVFLVRGKMDRWEGIKEELFRYKIIILRSHRVKKDEYEEGVRNHITRAGSNMGLNRAAHFEERKANAETANIDVYKDLKNLSDALEELNLTLGFIKDKIFWLKSVREEIIEEARGLFTLNNNDYTSES